MLLSGFGVSLCLSFPVSIGRTLRLSHVLWHTAARPTACQSSGRFALVARALAAFIPPVRRFQAGAFALDVWALAPSAVARKPATGSRLCACCHKRLTLYHTYAHEPTACAARALVGVFTRARPDEPAFTSEHYCIPQFLAVQIYSHTFDNSRAEKSNCEGGSR